LPCWASDIETIGAAVARHWGLDDGAAHDPPPSAGHTRAHPESDDDMLRTVASCANEAVRAGGFAGQRSRPGLQQVVQRYGRVLNLHLRDLQAALQGQPPSSAEPTRPAPLDMEPPAARPGMGREAAATRSAEPPGERPGRTARRLGRFELLRELGRGAQASVCGWPTTRGWTARWRSSC
jgi:hypothetical protein